MKNILILAVALIGTLSHASHTTCSAPELYYSSVRADMGVAPPPQTPVGNLTIVAKGKVLVDHTYYSGFGQFSIPEYEVAFVGPREELSSTGTPVFGSKVYRDTAVLRTAAPLPSEEILRTPVVCETTWALVP